MRALEVFFFGRGGGNRFGVYGVDKGLEVQGIFFCFGFGGGGFGVEGFSWRLKPQ